MLRKALLLNAAAALLPLAVHAQTPLPPGGIPGTVPDAQSAPPAQTPYGGGYGAHATSANAFNPAIGVVLSGTYGHFSRDPARYTLPGFALGSDATPGARGFSLGESELAMYANVDDKFYGSLIAALEPDNTASVEEAYIQTIGLGHGATVRAGRFFSGIGYLNAQHAHVWDFVDAPLPYRAMLNNQYDDDGVRLTWLAPTNLYTLLGVEAFRGNAFPAGGAAIGGTGARSAFVHVGGDVGASSSWRAGLSRLYTRANDRRTGDTAAPDRFSGHDTLDIVDAVWKWAPNGNATITNFKLQGEYFHRNESGRFTAGDGAVTDAAYSGRQSGWYVQGVYQFMPRWRAGLRHDAVSANAQPGLAGTVLDGGGYRPRRDSVMVDFSNSEFSRVRVQYNRDRSQPKPDNQVFVQYLMSIGAHGAHRF